MCQCQWDIVPVLLVPCPGSTSPFHDRTQCIGRALPWPDQLPSVHKHNLNTGLVAPVDLSPPQWQAGETPPSLEPSESFERRGGGRATHCQWHPGGQAPNPIPDSPFKVSIRLLKLPRGVHTGRRGDARAVTGTVALFLNGGSFEAVMRRL
jgi:hypothetical protein